MSLILSPTPGENLGFHGCVLSQHKSFIGDFSIMMWMVLLMHATMEHLTFIFQEFPAL